MSKSKELAKETVESAYGIATGYQAFIGEIKDKLQQLQLKLSEVGDEVGASKYEKMKDMWAELHTRMYKEGYLLRKVIAPEINRFIDSDCELVKGEVVHEYNVMNDSGMWKLYNDVYNECNRRVYKLRDTAENIIAYAEDDEFKERMVQSLSVFDKYVVPCVTQNYKNQLSRLGRDVSDVDKIVAGLSYDTIGEIDVVE